MASYEEVQRSSSSLSRRFFPKRNDEKPRRSNVKILSVPDDSAIQTRVAFVINGFTTEDTKGAET